MWGNVKLSNILFITVGGSPEPVVKAIQSFKPNLIYFIVTDHTNHNRGSIDLVGEDEYLDFEKKKQPTIPKRLSLKNEQYTKIIVDADDPFDVYEKVSPLVEEHLQKFDQVHLDCTGGTKPMSVGLAYINSEYPNTNLSFITGQRFDLVKVISGMERVKRFSKNKVFINRQIKNSKTLIGNRDYYGAYQLLWHLTTEFQIEDDNHFDRLYYLSQGFDAWDKFQYERASLYISRYKDDDIIKPYNAILQQLINIEKLVKNWTPETRIPTHNGFILVYDLLYNAERKAAAKYYDDAVSRVYRALEMYEQFALFTNNPPLNTSDLDVNKLPENIQSDYENSDGKKVQLGLQKGYDLLEKLDHPIGKVWASYKKKILDTLKFRNHSYFAHGYNPVTDENYESMKNVVWEFIYECDKAMGFRSTIRDYLQLPDNF